MIFLKCSNIEPEYLSKFSKSWCQKTRFSNENWNEKKLQFLPKTKFLKQPTNNGESFKIFSQALIQYVFIFIFAIVRNATLFSLRRLFLNFEYIQYLVSNSVPTFLNETNEKKHAVKSKLMKIFLWINNERDIPPGLYIVPHFPPLVRGRGNWSKGLEIWKEIKGENKRKKENLGKIELLAVSNHKNWLVKHNHIVSKP